MPQNQSRGNNKYPQIDKMSTEELREILREDIKNPKGEKSDLEMILYVMEVLAERRKASSDIGKTPEEAFDSFKKNYMPIDDSLPYLEDNLEWEDAQKTKPNRSWWKRGLSVAAVVFAVVFLFSATASAFGFDIFGTIAKWTKDVFQFGDGKEICETEPTISDRGEETHLQQFLERLKIKTQLAPTWIPDGYEFVDVKIEETPLRRNYLAIYQNGEKMIKVQIKECLEEDPQQVEKSDSLVEVYESNGIAYYIFSNYDQRRAVWINEKYECYISGELTIEELKMMIDSIQKE